MIKLTGFINRLCETFVIFNKSIKVIKSKKLEMVFAFGVYANKDPISDKKRYL